ncbi:MAG: VWA domain-containing protein [Acidobacteria bacterium]|nr:VWA domain-containing protein [Acidobacteriota bacterium]
MAAFPTGTAAPGRRRERTRRRRLPCRPPDRRARRLPVHGGTQVGDSSMRRHHWPLLAALLAVVTATTLGAQNQEGPSFRGGVEPINVTATVTDDDSRFVSGLRKEDFTVLEDDERQDITHFSSDRVPVSLGLVLDASGSMTPDKMSAARSAIDRLIYDLLSKDDELFFLEFANRPDLVQEWTTDRRVISHAVARVTPAGGTAMYDAIAEALPLAGVGRHPKKAILAISDGNDTNSRLSVGELRQRIRESEVLVYALGVDGTVVTFRAGPTIQLPLPRPFPIPGRGRAPQRRLPPIIGGGDARVRTAERVNADALRQITDDTGGRTELVRGFGDLDGATARIADELSKQYYLGYVSPGKKDGRWHAIRLDVKDRRLTVRARRGYIAS